MGVANPTYRGPGQGVGKVDGAGTPAPPAPTERLVVSGLYRYVRNPMYVAVLAVIVGQALLLSRPVLLAYAAAVAAAFGAFVRWYEQPTLARRYGAQYEAVNFPQLPGLHIIPKLTMGENIGDLGGILMALDAYHLSLHGQPAPVIDGFTGDQRVFMGWAQVWRTLTRDDALRQLITTNPHSPGQVRAFAPLRNVDAWYEAFGVKEGDAEYLKPEERVRIW